MKTKTVLILISTAILAFTLTACERASTTAAPIPVVVVTPTAVPKIPTLAPTQTSALQGNIGGTLTALAPGGAAVLPGTPGAAVKATITSTPTITATPTVTGTPTNTKIPCPVITGSGPTFGICSVVGDSSVTIQAYNFPKDTNFTVRMGRGSQGINGLVIGTYPSNEGGTFQATYNIPDGLKGVSPISMRIEFPDGYAAYNFFFNLTVN